MTSLLKPRNLLPAAALLAVTFFLVNAVPHELARFVSITAVHAAGFDVARAEIQACEAAGGRSHDECVEETAGKALIRGAESAAEQNAQRDPDPDDALALAAPTRLPRTATR